MGEGPPQEVVAESEMAVGTPEVRGGGREGGAFERTPAGGGELVETSSAPKVFI